MESSLSDLLCGFSRFAPMANQFYISNFAGAHNAWVNLDFEIFSNVNSLNDGG